MNTRSKNEKRTEKNVCIKHSKGELKAAYWDYSFLLEQVNVNNNKCYPLAPVDLAFSFSFLHSDIVFDALAITLEK